MTVLLVGVIGSLLPIWECPWCLGNGKMAPHWGFVFDHELLECCMCSGQGKVAGIRRLAYDPLKEARKQYGEKWTVPLRLP